MKKNIAFLLASMFVFSIATNAYASTQSKKKICVKIIDK